MNGQGFGMPMMVQNPMMFANNNMNMMNPGMIGGNWMNIYLNMPCRTSTVGATSADGSMITGKSCPRRER